MSAHVLTVLTSDFINAEVESSVLLYSTEEKAKEALAELVKGQTETFDELDMDYTIDQTYDAGTEEKDCTDENCTDFTFHNESGLSVRLWIAKMPIQ